jgi:hypothetical protein
MNNAAMDNAAIINQLLSMKDRSNDLTPAVVEVFNARDDLRQAILHLCMRVLFLDDLKNKEALTAKVFRKAYMVLSLRIHPDKNADNATAAAEAFKKLQTALEILNLALEMQDEGEKLLQEALQYKKKPPQAAVPPPATAPSGAAGGGGAAAASNPQPPQPPHYPSYQQRKCYCCGDPSHVASFCPKRRAAAASAAAAAAAEQRYCFKCGDPSHMANFCPLRRGAGAAGAGAAASAYPTLCRHGKHCVFHMQRRCKFGHPE